MKTLRTALPLVLALASAAVGAQTADPISSDGDKYRVVLENQYVRVLAYEDRPGEKTHPHRHPAFVAVAVAPFQRRIHVGDGRTLERRFGAGDVIFSDGETHIGENIGTTPTRVVLVELKQLPEGAPKAGTTTPASGR